MRRLNLLGDFEDSNEKLMLWYIMEEERHRREAHALACDQGPSTSRATEELNIAYSMEEFGDITLVSIIKMVILFFNNNIFDKRVIFTDNLNNVTNTESVYSSCVSQICTRLFIIFIYFI